MLAPGRALCKGKIIRRVVKNVNVDEYDDRSHINSGLTVAMRAQTLYYYFFMSTFVCATQPRNQGETRTVNLLVNFVFKFDD